MRKALRSGPVLLVSNHTAWWDPLVALVLCERVFGADAYAMMDGKNLRTLPFFAKVGAFGVDLDDRADGARAIRYAKGLLDRPGRLVWIFSQGRERPVTARPLGFGPGSGAVARAAKEATVIPLAIRYEHGSEPEAAVWISCGAAVSSEKGASDARAVAQAQERAVVAELDGIEAALHGGSEDASPFAVLYSKRPSAAERLMTSLLALLTRPAIRPLGRGGAMPRHGTSSSRP